jgi:ABC-type amino acid transport system permease subunit
VQLFQGTPLLMQLFICYFGLAMLGVDTSPLLAASICLILYTSAYLTEIWRGCVIAIPRGQWEAAASLAMNLREQLQHIIVPQATRIAIAPTVGFLVQVIKGTALTSVIGFVDQGGSDDRQCHLRALPRLQLRWPDVLRPLLSTFDLEPPHRAETPGQILDSPG